MYRQSSPSSSMDRVSEDKGHDLEECNSLIEYTRATTHQWRTTLSSPVRTFNRLDTRFRTYAQQKLEIYQSLQLHVGRRRRYLLVSLAVFLLSIIIIITMHPKAPHQLSILMTDTAKGPSSQKPKGLKVTALVYYGRRYETEILSCYLQKNLVRNGGWLDEVRFIGNTGNEKDLAWVHETATEVPEFRVENITVVGPLITFSEFVYQNAGRDSVLIKMDDDVVFFSDDAIPELVTSMVRRPDAMTICANGMNDGHLGWVFTRLELIHTYYPEPRQPSMPNAAAYSPFAWRASALPTYNGTVAHFLEDEAAWKTPYRNHRWLPLRDNDTAMHKYPAYYGEFKEPAPFNYLHWQSGAQEHYSFLQNLEEDKLDQYHFGGPDGLFNLQGQRTSFNFCALRGDDVLLAHREDLGAWGGDEQFYTVEAPRLIGKKAYIHTRAIAAHFSFGPQSEGMHSTDLRGRYRAYANEMVCPENPIPIREYWPGYARNEDFEGQ